MLAALPVIDLDLFLADPSSPAAQLEADKVRLSAELADAALTAARALRRSARMA